MITKETLKAYQRAFDNFREDTKAVESAILNETNGCSLELFEDTTYRILCDHEIGNRYNSQGIIISIPKLNCDDYDGKDGQHFFDNAIEEMDWLWETTIENKWEDYLVLCRDKWLEEQNENELDDYLEEQNENELDDYLEEQNENELDDYLEEQNENELDDYLEEQNENELDDYLTLLRDKLNYLALLRLL